MKRFTVLLFLITTVLSCGDTNYADDWEGSWYDQDGDMWEFNDNGVFGYATVRNGYFVHIDNVGTYTVTSGSFILDYEDGMVITGRWVRQGGRLTLYGDNGFTLRLEKE